MFRTILVPLNGSRFAEAALPLAARLARGARAQLHLVMAHQPVAALVGMGEAVVPPSGLDEDLRAQEESYLAERAARLGRVGRGRVGFKEVEGPAGPAICDEATRLQAGLIVMATHGRGAVGRLWLGSVADYVVRHIAVPVLLVHPGRDEPQSAEAGRGILVALDLSPQAEAILEPVVSFAQLTEAHVTLVHVVERIFEMGKLTVPTSIPLSPDFAEASRAEAQQKLDRVADRLRERGLSVSTRVVIGLDVAGTLVDALKDPTFGLVAMTTHGVGGMRRLLMGSVATKLLRKTAKPLLLLRPPPAF
ncbi:MAG TPA: universal stress protein [Gemmatimonadales bacterium]|nr:universal stress protein [Gemmatimonadales bacterium]